MDDLTQRDEVAEIDRPNASQPSVSRPLAIQPSFDHTLATKPSFSPTLTTQPSFTRVLAGQPSSSHSLLNQPSFDRTLLASRPSLYQTQATVKPDEPDFEVKFETGDPANPLNWSRRIRWLYSVVASLLVFNATFSSTAPSNILPAIRADLGFNQEEGNLIVAIFVTGFCFGPLLWGPISENVGRRPIFIITFFVFTCFQVGCALAPNTAALLVFRFLAGTFAAAPLTNSGAVTGDLWDPKTRAVALTLFSAAPFGGPALGPVVSGWIAVSGTDWRWLFWTLSIFSGVCLVLAIVALPETYAPIILVKKAKRMRKETGDSRYYAPMETTKVSFAQRANMVLATPFKIMFQEPVLIALTLYMSFAYGCMYLLFEAYPIVFNRDHHMDAGVAGLTFLPFGLGGVIGCIFYLVFYTPAYNKLILQHAPNPVPPEAHLSCTRLAAFTYTIAFFWFGWTSYSSISFWSPMMAGGLLGFSIALIFLSLFNYIIGMYLFVAASALAGTTFFRSLFGAVFPLFATQLYDALGARWASTLLGCIAVLMIPIPFLLIRFGPLLRSRSKFAPDLPQPVVAVPLAADGEPKV